MKTEQFDKESFKTISHNLYRKDRKSNVDYLKFPNLNVDN